MPNVFDQFDPPSTQTAAPVASSSNVFDQFDTSKTGNNVFDQFDSPSSAAASTTPAADQAAAEPSLVGRVAAFARSPSPAWIQPVENFIKTPLVSAETIVPFAQADQGLPNLQALRQGKVQTPSQPPVIASPVGQGIAQGVGEAASQFTSPGSLALLPLIPEGMAGKAVAAGFTVQGLAQYPDLYKQYQATNDPKERARILATAATLIAPAAGLLPGRKAPVEAAGTVPAPTEAPPVVGNEQFARVAPANERAGAAVPADIPAPAQSTILESATQPEPKPVVPITEQNAAQAATDIGGLSYGGVQSWPADSGIPSTLEFTITEPGKETTLSVPPGITPEELAARRDQKLADFAAAEQPTEEQTNASSEPIATGVSSGEVRGAVDEGTPLRQQGETAPVRPQGTERGSEPQQTQEAPITGISQARTEAELGAGSVEPGVGAEMGSGLAYGRNYINKGGDPRLPIRRAQTSGLVGKNEVGIVHAELERLRGVRDEAAKVAEANPNDPVAQENLAKADTAQRAWRKELQPVLTKASDALREAYAESAIPDVGTYSGLSNLMDEHFNGKHDLTPEDRTTLQKVAKTVDGARTETAQSVNRVVEATSKRASRVMTPSELRNDLASVLTDAFKDCFL